MNERTSLQQLEARIRDVSLDLDPEAMRQAAYQVVDYLVERISNIRMRTLGEELRREETEKILREPLPENPSRFQDVFEIFARDIAPNTISLDHPRFFAFIPSSPNFVSVLADFLAAGTNVFAGTWLESSGPSQVELLVIDWFKEMLGLPAEAAGLLVSGGSVANLTALAVARRAVLNDRTERAVVYLSDQTHTSIDRGLRLLGIQAGQLQRIPVDSQYRVLPDALAEQISADRAKGLHPMAVIANAGATSTGAVDPLAEIAQVCRENSLWFHVDAAYGGFAALTKRGRQLLTGIEYADSLVLDPHKWLYCPFEVGCVIVRRGDLMRETFRILPEYMQDVAREKQEVNFCDYGLQLTRSFRALKVWMALKTFGAARFREVIDQCLDLTEYASLLFQRSPRFEIVTPPSLGVFTFRYCSEQLPQAEDRREEHLNRLNEALMARIISSRSLMLSSTRLGTQHVLRFCVLNHRTRKNDILESCELIERFGHEVEQELG
jgi:aromatic-L-amino-acid decarboxylase